MVSPGRPLLFSTLAGNTSEVFISALSLGLCHFQDLGNQAIRAEERRGDRCFMFSPREGTGVKASASAPLEGAPPSLQTGSPGWVWPGLPARFS